MASKLVVTDTRTNHTFDYQLTRPETRIGRAGDRSDLVLDDGQVSRVHALVRRTPNGYMLVDLDSANGTWVDEQRVKEKPLSDGDTFAISKYTFEFKAGSGTTTLNYENQPVGGTVFMRKPDDLAGSVPKLDRAAMAGSDPNAQSVIDTYVQTLLKKAETLSRIYELNQMLSGDFALEAIFKKVSEMVFRLTPADRFLVLLRDADTGDLHRAATEFRNPARTATGEITISRTVVDRVLQEGVSLLSLDTTLDQRLVSAKSIIMQNIRSVMCAPLLGKSGALGVIYVDCTEPMKILREDDLDLLNAVAAEASIAVDNAITHKQLVREELARAKYRRFMAPHVVDEILKNPDALNLGGTNSCVTMLFSDVRGFTSMSENLEPEKVVQVLNEYFADMTPIVFEHRGMLDKYMGDGLMALFGVPLQCEDAATNAVAAAIAMQRRMEAVNRDLRSMGMSEIAIGIGINTGTVTVGYIGSEERTDYTAIGDAVNLAARLEKQAQAGQIIISRSTRDFIGDHFPVRPAGEVYVKGKAHSVQIFEVLWREAEVRARHTDPGR
ncbi:MAG TPA: adenylate/guanylate cyclase domain-containing protein [Blastocatellia bacterium]|nr:adenylate/guanylate cyclase domain-containing protein [Blastocatellia bacterium]